MRKKYFIKILARLFILLAIMLVIFTFIGTVYVFLTESKVGTQYVLILMVFSLLFTNIAYRLRKTVNSNIE